MNQHDLTMKRPHPLVKGCLHARLALFGFRHQRGLQLERVLKG